MASSGTSDAARYGQAMAHYSLPSLLAQEVEGAAWPASRANKGDAGSDSPARPIESLMECRTNRGYLAASRLRSPL